MGRTNSPECVLTLFLARFVVNNWSAANSCARQGSVTRHRDALSQPLQYFSFARAALAADNVNEVFLEGNWSRLLAVAINLDSFAQLIEREPDASSFPCEMIAISLHSRSTISSTCDVRKTVNPRAVSRESKSFSVREAIASTPSKGSSRKNLRAMDQSTRQGKFLLHP